MAEHRGGYIFLIVFTFLCLIVTIFLNYVNSLSSFGGGLEFLEGLYISTISETSDLFYTEIEPAGWTFQIWIFIYLYQLAWMIYALTLLCRKSNDWQGYLYYRPNFMPISFYVVYIINLGANVGWLISFDRKILVASSPLLFVIAITLYICIAISYNALYREGELLLRIGHGREIMATRALVQNGLATYAAWTTVASVLGVAQVLTYQVGLDQEDASSIALGILAVETIFFFLFDNLVVDKFSRYTFTPYLVVIWALIGSIVKNWEFGKRNSILTAVDLGLAVFAFLIKLTMVVGRNRRNPEPILERRKNDKPNPIQS